MAFVPALGAAILGTGASVAAATVVGGIVTAGAVSVPQALLEQLADGGRLIIPVGEQTQILKIITRDGDNYSEQQVEAVRFVPLVPGDLL